MSEPERCYAGLLVVFKLPTTPASTFEKLSQCGLKLIEGTGLSAMVLIEAHGVV